MSWAVLGLDNMFNVGGAVIAADVVAGPKSGHAGTVGTEGDSIEVKMYGPGSVLLYVSSKPAGLLVLEEQGLLATPDASRLRLKQPLAFDYDSVQGLLRAKLPEHTGAVVGGAGAQTDGGRRFCLTILL